MSKKALLLLFSVSLLWAEGSVAQTFYGTTRHGGASNGGTIFKVKGDGSGISIEYNFIVDNLPGRLADFSVMYAHANGLLYGTTMYGGTTDTGVMFSYNPANGSYAILLEFDHLVNRGAAPIGKFVLYNGLLYGVTNNGGSNYNGTIYSINPTTGDFQKVFDFTDVTGTHPLGGLTLGPDNMMYGMTSAGGTSDHGTLYQFNPTTKAVTVKHNFDVTTGSLPIRELTLGTNNLMYGMTVLGGVNDQGVLFEFNTNTGVLTKKINFDTNTTGQHPIGSLLQSTSTGKFYGGTPDGGTNGGGTLFEYDPVNSTITTKVNFTGTDGKGSFNILARTADDKMYGSTEYGGASDQGVIFEFIPSTGAYTKKFDFTGYLHGSPPKTGLTLASNGNFYGMTTGGGAGANGTLFEWNPGTNAYVVKIAFKMSTSGIVPDGTMVQAANGKLLGTATQGELYGSGVIYEFDPLTKVYTKKFGFGDSQNSGGNPLGGIVLANNGKYYGLSQFGGVNGPGLLYEYNYSNNTFTKKVDLAASTHGAGVTAPLTISGDVAYGVAVSGGTSNMGTIFEYNYMTNAFTKQVDFIGTNGASPSGPLVLASDGKFYGMTSRGGTLDLGVLYQYDPTSHAQTVKVSFDEPKGYFPEGGLIEVDGKLYGVTANGGANTDGTIFEYDIATGSYTKKIDLDYRTGNPRTTFVRGAGKKLYARCEFSGDYGFGAVFEYDITENKVTVKDQFTGPNGSNPGRGALLAVKLPPVVQSFTPESGTVGSTVQITGSNFSGNASENIVYFGAVKATVTAATSTQLIVTVPPGANFQLASVTVGGLTGYSPKPFITTFAGASAASFGPSIEFTPGSYPLGATVADLDGDGRTEIIVASNTSNTISVFPNNAAQGTFLASSLSTKFDLQSNGNPVDIAAGDVDGDGKLDIVVANASSFVSVFRNKTTGPGLGMNTTFDTRIDFPVGTNSYSVALGDIDGDGRLDIVAATNTAITVLRNTSTPGSISISSFAAKVDEPADPGSKIVKVWDIDGDKKLDVIVGNAGGNVSIYRNQSTPGSYVAGGLATKVDFAVAAVSSLAIGDVDKDGKPDIAVFWADVVMSVYRNTSTVGAINASSLAARVDFTVPSGSNGTFTDIDGNGNIDLVVSTRSDSKLRFMWNSGNGAVNFNTLGFGPLVVAVGNGPGAVVTADLDNDGKPDFITLNNAAIATNTISVVRNNIVAQEPAAQPTNLAYTSVSSSGMTVTFTAAAGADGYLVLMSNTAISFNPTDGVAYAKDAIVATSGGNNTVVAYSGPNITFTLSQLPAATDVNFKVFAYNGAASIINYLTTAPLAGVRTTLAAEPTVQAKNIVVTAGAAGSVTIAFTNGNGVGRLVVAKAGGQVDGLPVDGTTYAANNNLASAPAIGTGNLVVANSSPATLTGLTNGTTYWFRVYEYNGTSGIENYLTTTDVNNPLSFVTDNTPPTVTLSQIGATPTGVQVNVSATVADGESPITDVTMYFRSISVGGTPTSKPMAKGTGNNYSAAIDASAVGELGVEYKVKASSGGGTFETPYTAITVSAPAIGVTVAYDAFGSEQKNYRIIAIPLALSAQTVAAVFDELGAIDKKKWRLSRYASNSNTELSLTDVIEPGKGYWLIIKTAGGAINTGAGNTVSTTTDVNFSIDLTAGWNQIGNPYPFNLLWQDVIDANPGLPVLRTYRSDNPAGGDYPWGNGTVLRAKEGGFINNTGSLTKLKFPVKKNVNAGRELESPLLSNPLTDRNWQLYITARHNDLVNQISGIGMRENASENSDAFDGYSMPRFFDRYLEINHKKKTGDDYMSMDIVPPAGEHTWSFDVESSETDRFITLEWDNTNFGDNDKGMILWDDAHQFATDMRTNNSYTFDRSISKSFKIYFGNADKLAEKIEIKGLFLHSLSPNPAESDVKIAFSVPASQKVDFEAIDLMGRAVWQSSGTFDKGYHEVTWGGETRSNSRGLYIIRLKSGDETIVSRIYLK